MNNAPRQKEAENKMSDRWNILTKQAIMSEHLLKFLWTDDKEDFTKISPMCKKKKSRKRSDKSPLLRAKSDEPSSHDGELYASPPVKLRRSSSEQKIHLRDRQKQKLSTEELTFFFLVEEMKMANLMC